MKCMDKMENLKTLIAVNSSTEAGYNFCGKNYYNI